jgi:hypothetical protein
VTEAMMLKGRSDNKESPDTLSFYWLITPACGGIHDDRHEKYANRAFAYKSIDK